MGKDVCHTEEECRELYASIEAGIRERAVRFLRSKIPPTWIQKWRVLLEKHGPNKWFYHICDEENEDPGSISHPHFGLGMVIRNAMREAGFGEKELGVHNLDCVYIEFLENAIKEA